ncbi:hypothetical protein DFJ77DRAFT_437944 [Powellomyces hirtus]|nr:hypothetical protein DFJ77DRAFT_437944 [Powellomyces hirtus]
MEWSNGLNAPATVNFTLQVNSLPWIVSTQVLTVGRNTSAAIMSNFPLQVADIPETGSELIFKVLSALHYGCIQIEPYYSCLWTASDMANNRVSIHKRAQILGFYNIAYRQPESSPRTTFGRRVPILYLSK